MKYYGGGQSAGNNFGAIVVLNHSGTACVWRGEMSVVPLAQDQQLMGDNGKDAETTARVMTATVRGILLSPHGYVVHTEPAPAGDRYGEINFIGDARDDGASPNGLCAPANQIRPAYWGVATLDHKFTVANYDRTNASNRGNSFVGVTACHGRFGPLYVAGNY